ncbi:MAG: methyltransferase domain-containing protein [Ruminococcus sp.]|nr:methyltransferase domain-containing protein [Ruminococcus sp.]
MRKTFSALSIAHAVIAERVKKGDICIDATAGRGFDTAYLCSLIGEEGKVISFDIQQDAIDSTAALLKEKGYLPRVRLIKDSHENMDRYAEKESAACITFNFGWLPGGDHSIHTQSETSVAAVRKALRLIRKGGIISMIIYYGRDTGFKEKETLLEFVKTVDSGEYTVITAEFSNRPNCPPIPVFILRE